MKRIANRNAGTRAGTRTPFRGSNLFGEYLTPLHTPDAPYVVYSYGPHWPLYVWDGSRWYENEDSYSSSTNRHRSQARPYTNAGYAETIPMPCPDLRQMVDSLCGQGRLALTA